MLANAVQLRTCGRNPTYSISSLTANVEYRVSGAEKMVDIKDHTVDLVAVAQAAQYVSYQQKITLCS